MRLIAIRRYSQPYLSGKSKASRDTAHRSWYKMIQVAIGWCGELQSSETNVVKCFIIDAICFIGVLNQLMHRQCRIVRLHNGVWYFRWWYNAECVHDSVWVFFSDLRNEKCSHAGAGSTAQRMCELEALKAITAFCLLANDIEYRIHEFCAFRVMSFSPIVTSPTLT